MKPSKLVGHRLACRVHSGSSFLKYERTKMALVSAKAKAQVQEVIADIDGRMGASWEVLELVVGGRFAPSRAEFGISSIVGVDRSQNLVAFPIVIIGVGA